MPHVSETRIDPQKDLGPGQIEPKGAGFRPTNKHFEFERNETAWKLTKDVYLGAEGMVPSAKEYIPQRERGEADKSYEERISTAHFVGLLGALVDALVGLWARKPPEEDAWGVLGGEMGEDGEPAEDSIAGRVIKDADRRGTTLDNFRRSLATWMLVFRKVYVFVDTNRPPGEMTEAQASALNVRPFVNRIAPLNLLDWIEKDGRKVEAVIREGVDARDSLDDGEAEEEERWLRLRLDGWERIKAVKVGDERKFVTTESGSYEYEDDEGKPRLPLVEVTLPLPRYAAYNLALLVLAIVNLDSYLDNLLRGGSLAQYLAIQGDEDDVRNSVSTGDKILTYPTGQNEPSFVGLDMGPASHIESRVEKLISRFWQTAMYEFSDSTREVTATQIEQEWASGIGATLTLISESMEEADNEIKALLAQAAQGPNADTSEIQTSFSREFKVEDVLGEMQRLKDLIFGAGAEIPLSGRMESLIGAHIISILDEQLNLLSQQDPDADPIDLVEEALSATRERALENSRFAGITREFGNIQGFPEEEEEEVTEEEVA